MSSGTLDPAIDAGAVTSEALTWPDRARATAIVDTATYLAAAELLKGIKALRVRIGETFDPHIGRAFTAHRALCKEKQDAEAPLTEAERILKSALVAYDDTQERIRRAEEARLREEARLAEERQQLEVAAAMELEAQRTDDPALLLEAIDLFEQPLAAPAVIVQRTTPKVAGISFRETWSARVVNVKALVAYVAAHPECANYLTPNLAALSSAVRAQRQGFKVPGVEAVCQKTAAAGAR